ncbi:uncharacterized protein EDB91DRAFT_1086961 [Suillus paluster]|uniref:uncharacterized protein n=1 Tax=Suillus paluster TaxID=48578 RepID=UPI001B860EA0|nr:uncharacterized protein EDB91DRAFT_1086961 [Suillus paluster]KAG1725887.1 hypothetical protein EDB91DRAFT_1086961 [Suillus paluster]
MITSGIYKIRNVLHPGMYANMASATNKLMAFVEGDTFEVDVKDHLKGLVTIKDKYIGELSYVVINDKTNEVEGSTEPQVLQLSTQSGSGDEYLIHVMDVDNVWILGKALNKDYTYAQITTAPAPPPTDEDYKKKYWKFEKQ